jgi:hypothetical protein
MPMVASGATLLLVSVCVGVLLIGGVFGGGFAAPASAPLPDGARDVAEAEPEMPAEEAADAAAPAEEEAPVFAEIEEAEEEEAAAVDEMAEAEEPAAEAAVAQEEAADAAAIEEGALDQEITPQVQGTPQPLPTQSIESAAPVFPPDAAQPPGPDASGAGGGVGGGDLGSGGAGRNGDAVGVGEAEGESQPESLPVLPAEEPAPAEAVESDIAATPSPVATATVDFRQATQVAERVVPEDRDDERSTTVQRGEAIRPPRPYFLLGLAIGVTAVLGVLLMSAGVGIALTARRR